MVKITNAVDIPRKLYSQDRRLSIANAAYCVSSRGCQHAQKSHPAVMTLLKEWAYDKRGWKIGAK
jgi:hypothetical protein